MGWLFGRKTGTRAEEDRVWKSSSARDVGIRREVERLRAQGHGVIVVAWTAHALEKLASDLAPFAPQRCVDAFSRGVVAEIGQGAGVVVALAAALPETPATARNAVDILVVGRNASRASDEAVSHMAHELGPRASVAFHLALDDTLLAERASRLGPLVEALDVPEDEPITNSLVTRAIRNLQER